METIGKSKFMERFVDCIKILFKKISCEVSQCKNCKSKKVGVCIKKKGNLIIKAYHCKNCGRRFWSEEKILNKKPKWYK